MKNALDIGVVEGSVHTEDLICEPFMDDEVLLVVGRPHPFFHAPMLEAARLSYQDILLREKGSGTRELFESMMAAHSIPFQQRLESASSDGIVAAAQKGFGIGVISGLLVKDEIKAGTLKALRIKDLCFVRKFSLVFHKNKYLSRPMRDFVSLCKKKRALGLNGDKPKKLEKCK